MKKIMIAILVMAVAASCAYAVTYPTDQDYKNLDDLREKLVRMKREMDKFMKDIISTYPNQAVGTTDIFGQDVRVDVAESDKDVIVRADLPGMDKDRIDVTLENNKMLKIAGSREIAKKESAPGVIKQERMSGHFERVIELPVECLSEGIRATYKNGVLEIVIPKKPAAKAETVKISVQ